MTLRSRDNALVFDLGNVIVAHDNDLLYERLASRCTAENAVERIRQSSHDARLGMGVLPVEMLHAQMMRELGYSADWATFAEDWCCHFEVDPQMLDFIQHLGQSHRVMIFSNTNAVHWNMLVDETDGALALIESYLSHEIGDVKPNVSAFDKLAKAARIDPTRSIFTDDVAANVEAARQAGFIAHQFTDQPALERFLREQGIS
ncbi:MAG TPA: HAD-IA family hydrolase [Alphaproteobacteria bacterium]|nr:HAD-IA family hydrolase [Alphaproteobacteria bacterium]